MMKLVSRFEEFSEGDLTPEELEALLKSGGEGEKPLSPRARKEQYFEFYDDVKDKSLKKQDW